MNKIFSRHTCMREGRFFVQFRECSLSFGKGETVLFQTPCSLQIIKYHGPLNHAQNTEAFHFKGAEKIAHQLTVLNCLVWPFFMPIQNIPFSRPLPNIYLPADGVIN